MRISSAIRANTRVPLLQAVKTSLAATLAWGICLALFPTQLPIFAAIAALLVVQPSVNQSLGKAVERSSSVLLGVLLAYGFSLLFENHGWVVLVAIVASILLGWALRLTPGSAVQIPISAMLVLTIGGESPQYALDRVLETLIGAAIGVVINVVLVPPVVVQPARLAVARLARDTAATFEALTDAVTEPRSRAELAELLDRARALRALRTEAEDAVERGRDSLTLNPRQARHRAVLERDIEMLARLSMLVTRVLGMARAMHDHYHPGLASEPTT